MNLPGTTAPSGPERRLADRPISPEDVAWWLERAGITLQCLPDRSPRLGLRLMSVELRMVAEAGRGSGGRVRPTIGAGDVSAMDEALGWLGLIGNGTVRRIVAARLLLNPVTERHRFSFRAIGRLIGADHHAVAQWWRAGIATIAASLNGAERGGEKPGLKIYNNE